MNRFENLDETTAPLASRPLLEKHRQAFGVVAAPLSRVAASPSALGAITEMLERFERSSLGPAEREVLAFTMGHANRCDYCMALHSALAARVPGVAEHVGALRRGELPADARLAALALFVRTALAHAGAVPADSWQAFLDAGYSKENALDVLVGIATYTLTTFSNRLVEAPLDAFLERFRWELEREQPAA
jgi:AhpD family alkylhydroperoxidase